MKQALHILQKDVRHLWIEISVVLFWTSLLVYACWPPDLAARGEPMSRTTLETICNFLLPLSWLALIMRAVYSETIVGDSEFWQTRPYRWQSLMAAKAILFALVIHLPMSIAQAVILDANGLSWRAELGGLLSNQVWIAVLCTLPVSAVAALTSGFVQFVAAVLVA